MSNIIDITKTDYVKHLHFIYGFLAACVIGIFGWAYSSGPSDCAACGGTGQMTVTCSKCGGSGKWFLGVGKCSACDGNGTVNSNCEDCGGKGTVDSNRRKQ